ncbi:MAG: class I SAM-dependent methyltransferase [Cyclobacteriaceae bacterium]|nr:class I SAM-dependent methyltransferase [Cyclobacteriaceae bacterium]
MFKKFANKYIRRKIYQIDAAYPSIKLDHKHLKNLTGLPGRMDLLQLLPHDGVVAEIGVAQGEFSDAIIEICHPSKLHLVDVWHSERYHISNQEKITSRHKTAVQNGQLEFNIGLSTEVVHSFQDHYFDWIYLDTDHSYALTKQELKLYQHKIKPGGMICGHDYISGNWKGLKRYGVIEAVHEFCIEQDWEIIYLTFETSLPPSFAIRKMAP